MGFGATPQGLSPLQGQVPFRRNGITCYTILTMGVFRAKLGLQLSTEKQRQNECKGGVGMAHVMKHTKAACGHMFKHYERAQDENGEYIKFGNQDIDKAFSGMNYNFAPDREISQGDFVRQRCSEVRMQNRKDVNVMCSWVVTLPKGMEKDERAFFAETYRFLSERYGKENVVSAYVHKDENQPHMHYAFVPVVEDKKRGGYKVSAKEAIDRKDLQTFHKDLDARMTKAFGRDVGILNEATKEGNKSIEELKRGTAAERISEANREAEQIIKATKAESHEILEAAREKVKKAQSGIESLEAKEKALQRKIEGLEGDFKARELKINEITAIRPQRTFTGSIKGVTVEDIENLKKTAIVSLKTVESVQNLTRECERLQRKYEALEQRQPSMMDKMRDAKEKSRLLEIEKAFNKLPEDTQKQLLTPSRSQSRGRER